MTNRRHGYLGLKNCAYCEEVTERQNFGVFGSVPVMRGCDNCRNALTRLRTKVSFLKEYVACEPSYETSDGGITVVADKGYNRFILSDKSPVFRKMLETEMQDKSTGVIWIRDVTLSVMRTVIHFCYTADIVFTEEVTPEVVVEFAQRYDIAYLRDVCGDELVKRLNTENLPRMVYIAYKFDAKCLQSAVSKMLKENFDSSFPAVVIGLLEKF